MRTELVIKGNAVYEIDLDCLDGRENGGIYETCSKEKEADAPLSEKNVHPRPDVYENHTYHRG